TVMNTPVVAPATNSVPPPRTTASGTTGSRREKPPNASRTRTNAAATPGVRASVENAPGVATRGVTPASQRALCRRDSGDPRIRFDGCAQRPRHRLVLGLGDVVRIAAVVHADMQRDPGVVGEGLEHVAVEDRAVGRAGMADDHVCDHHLRLTAVHYVGPPGTVDDGLRESRVHRQRALAEASDAALVAEGLREGLPQDARRALHRVVCLDLAVTRRAHGEVEGAVLAEGR